MRKTKHLHPGDPFPALTVALPGGHTLRLPDDLAGHCSVILFYRGAWYPYCNAQLRSFQRFLHRLTGHSVEVAALSVDDETTTHELIAKHGLPFPVGHSADARTIRMAALGADGNGDSHSRRCPGASHRLRLRAPGTLRADGSPRNRVTRVGLAGDRILAGTSDAIWEAKDMLSDPRAASSVTDMVNPPLLVSHGPLTVHALA